MYWISQWSRYIRDNFVIPSAFPKVKYERKITDESTLFRRYEKKGETVDTEYWLYGATKYLDVHNVNLLHDTSKKNDSKYINVYIAFHANGETCLEMIDYMQDYIAETKYTSLWLFIEYPGYGFNNSTTIELDKLKKLILEIHLDILEMLKNVGIKVKNTMIIGRSIGTAFAIWLSTKIKNHKMLLIHPFTSIFEVVLGKPQRTSTNQGKLFSPINILDNFATIKQTRSKNILIVHAVDDDIIHYEHSKMLFNLLEFRYNIKPINATLWLLPYGGHMPFFVEKMPQKSNTFYHIITNTTGEDHIPKKAVFYKDRNGNIEISLYKDLLDFIKY